MQPTESVKRTIVPLNLAHVVEITPAAPFNFNATLHKPDHFPTPDNAWEPGARWQTMRWQGLPLGLKFENLGSVDAPRVRLAIWAAGPLEQGFLDGLLAEIAYRYRFDLDLTDFNRRFAAHPRLGPVLTRWRGMRPLNYSSLYEYLMIAIVLQNATVRRSVQMMQALDERYGTPVSYDNKELYVTWAPEAIRGAAEDELRSLKVGYRAKSIMRVTEAFVSGQVDEVALRDCPRAEQRQALLALYGVGPASVEYILSDVFHHQGNAQGAAVCLAADDAPDLSAAPPDQADAGLGRAGCDHHWTGCRAADVNRSAEKNHGQRHKEAHLEQADQDRAAASGPLQRS